MNNPNYRVWSGIKFTAVHLPDEYSQETEEGGPISAHFKVYEIEGYEIDEEGEYTIPIYEKSTVKCVLMRTTSLTEAEPLLEGWIKWDGCSNWEFLQGIHFCRVERASQLAELFKRLYAWGRVLGVDRLDDQTQP